jgi:hypothetical protein
MFQAIEPVAICDQFGFFLSCQPEGEILIHFSAFGK